MVSQTEEVSHKDYALLFTAMYNYCAGVGFSARPNERPGGAGVQMLGRDMYLRIVAYLENRVQTIYAGAEELEDEPLLQYYRKQWDRYTDGAKYVNHLCSYLNRRWVSYEKDNGRLDVHIIYAVCQSLFLPYESRLITKSSQLALIQWKEFMYRQLQQHKKWRLTSALLRQVERQRNGEIVDTGMLKTVISSFVTLGLSQGEGRPPDLLVYRTGFEQMFLQETTRFYKAESSEYIAQNGVTDYMKKVEVRLREEEDRVQRYLHATTEYSLQVNCYQALIVDQVAAFEGIFDDLLRRDQKDDLKRMYRLLCNVVALLPNFRSKFEQFVKAKGLEATEGLAKGGEVDADVYFKAILEVHDSCVSVVKECFAGEAKMHAALDKACSSFVNSNAVTGTSLNKSPALVAQHTHRLLNKGAKGHQEGRLEQDLDDVMVIFKYLTDKDVFQKFYSKHLAGRLVQQTSASDDAELYMITKLKEACGYEYTSALQRMFQDVNVSKELNNSFAEYVAEQGGPKSKAERIDFSAMVLSSVHWPLTKSNSGFNPPQSLQRYIDQFNEYYTEKRFQGRKLDYLWNMSRAELTTKCFDQEYTLMISAWQAAILMAFNNAPDATLTYDELRSVTDIADELLKPNLTLLGKARVVAPLDGGKAFKINRGFKSKKLKFNLNVPIKTEQKQENNEVLQSVQQEREIKIQAAIVRIMKARKQLKHNLLIQTVIEQIRSVFKPAVPDIKKAIDVLIDKEYLERVEGQKDLYQYLA